MKKKKNILIDKPNANYNSNKKMLDKLDDIIENREKEKPKTRKKPI